MSINPRVWDVVRQSWPKTQSREPRAPKPPRRARKTGPSAAMLALVRGRAGGRCERCSRPVAPNTDVHHRIPRGMGGSRDERINQPSNLVVVCRECHTWIETRREHALAHGWLVARSGDPAAVSVASKLHGCVLLADDGSLTPAPIEGGAA